MKYIINKIKLIWWTFKFPDLPPTKKEVEEREEEIRRRINERINMNG